jgi:hypothetical protein
LEPVYLVIVHVQRTNAERVLASLNNIDARGASPRVRWKPHLLSGAICALLVLTAIGSAAKALGARFRLYSIATIVVMLVFAVWAAKDAPRIEAGLETPWVGVIERVSFY